MAQQQQDDAGTTAQGNALYDHRPVAPTGSVEVAGQSAQPQQPPDGNLFTQTSAISMGSSREHSTNLGDQQQSPQRKRDKARDKFDHAKDRARRDNTENKAKMRRAFGLRVSYAPCTVSSWHARQPPPHTLLLCGRYA